MNVFEEEARPWRELLNGWVWSSCGPARAILVSHSATGSVLASTRRGRAGGAADTSTAHALAAAQRHVLKLGAGSPLGALRSATSFVGDDRVCYHLLEPPIAVTVVAKAGGSKESSKGGGGAVDVGTLRRLARQVQRAVANDVA